MKKKLIALSTLPFLALGVVVPTVAAATVSKKPQHPGAEPYSFTANCNYEFVSSNPSYYDIDFTVSSVDCNLSTNPKTLEYNDLTIVLHGTYNTTFYDGGTDSGTFNSDTIDLGYNETGEVWDMFYTSKNPKDTSDYISAGLSIEKDWAIWPGNYGNELDIPVDAIIFDNNNPDTCYQPISVTLQLGF